MIKVTKTCFRITQRYSKIRRKGKRENAELIRKLFESSGPVREARGPWPQKFSFEVCLHLPSPSSPSAPSPLLSFPTPSPLSTSSKSNISVLLRRPFRRPSCSFLKIQSEAIHQHWKARASWPLVIMITEKTKKS